MDGSIFAQLQAAAQLEEETTIDSTRSMLGEIVNFFKSQERYDEYVTIFAEQVRSLNVQTLKDCDSFFIPPEMVYLQIPEDYRHDSYGICRNDFVVYAGRYVYPVKDTHGNVMGFCGYDKFEDPKYLDSNNYGYRAKTYCCWGMERLPEYYRNKDPVFFVEGIVCALYLRQRKLQSLALLGSSVSAYMLQIINRFGTRAVLVCDSDEAGTKCRQYVKKHCPLARCVQSRIAKDVDDSRLVDDSFATELSKLKNPFYKGTLFQ